jgi:hypothetical protein
MSTTYMFTCVKIIKRTSKKCNRADFSTTLRPILYKKKSKTIFSKKVFLTTKTLF